MVQGTLLVESRFHYPNDIIGKIITWPSNDPTAKCSQFGFMTRLTNGDATRRQKHTEYLKIAGNTSAVQLEIAFSDHSPKRPMTLNCQPVKKPKALTDSGHSCVEHRVREPVSAFSKVTNTNFNWYPDI